MSARNLVVACTLLMAGCAATPDGDKATAMLEDSSEATEQEIIGADSKKWVCKTEKITGSHRIERVCYSREVARSLRDKTRDGMFFHTRNTACTDCQDGG